MLTYDRCKTYADRTLVCVSSYCPRLNSKPRPRRPFGSEITDSEPESDDD